MDEHAAHKSHWLSWSMLGSIGTLTLAPYILPAIGIGQASKVTDLMHFLGTPLTPGAMGTGLAGTVQGGIAAVPGVGGMLTSTAPVAIPGVGPIAAGALATIAATAIIGIGGMLLANWMEKREQEGDFPWSKVVRFTALATSALIALPSILSALSLGIAFFGTLMGPEISSSTALAVNGSLGATSMHNVAGSLTALLPHFLTCGAAALPFVGALFMNKRDEKPETRISHAEKAGQVDLPPHGHILAS